MALACLVLALLLAVPLKPAQAQAYGSDWEAALAGGSARLQLFALQAYQPDGAADYTALLQNYLGLNHGGGLDYVAHSLGLSPVLEYDTNINGGTPGGYIRLGNFKFTLTEASTAKAGVVVGVAPSASLRLSLAPGRVIEAMASGQIARAPQHDLMRRSYALRLCGAQHLGRSDWLDLCLGRRGVRRILSEADESHASMGFSRLFATRYGLHEASIRLERVETQGFGKNSLDFGITHAAARVGIVDWRIELGQYIAGEHTRLAGVSLSLTRPILGQQTSVFAAGAREAGAEFFGTPREDQVFRMGLSRRITDRVSLSLSAEDRRSTLENYNGTTLGFSLNITLPPLSGG